MWVRKMENELISEWGCRKLHAINVRLSSPQSPESKTLKPTTRNPNILTSTQYLLVGKNLAYTSIRFTDKNDTIVARGSHTKYVALTLLYTTF